MNAELLGVVAQKQVELEACNQRLLDIADLQAERKRATEGVHAPPR